MIMEIKRKLAEELYAFRAGRATTDLVLEEHLIEKKQVCGKEVLIVFIHCKNVSDNVKRGEICESSKKNRNCNRPFQKSEKYI
jgi:hypothetical protein